MSFRGWREFHWTRRPETFAVDLSLVNNGSLQEPARDEFKIPTAWELIFSIFKDFFSKFSSRSGAGHCCHDDSRDWPGEMKFAPTYDLTQGFKRLSTLTIFSTLRFFLSNFYNPERIKSWSHFRPKNFFKNYERF